MHDSGAERALTADLAHDLGVEFAALSPDTEAVIGARLDDGLVPTNPLDVWGTGADTRSLFGACLRAMADDPGVAVTALAVDLVTEFDGDTAYADAVVDVAKQTDAPLAVLASVPSAIDRPTAQYLRDNGIPVLEGTRSGLAAMAHLAGWPLRIDTTDITVDTDRRQRWTARAHEDEVSSCWPTTACRWYRRGSRTAASRARGCGRGRLSDGAENRWGSAQE